MFKAIFNVYNFNHAHNPTLYQEQTYGQTDQDLHQVLQGKTRGKYIKYGVFHVTVFNRHARACTHTQNQG